MITLTREEALQVLDALQSVWLMDRTKKQRQTIETLRARLAQPEPEPHGYLWFTRHMEQRFTHRKPKEDERICDVKPIYTAPPQREWVGLTDEEVGMLTVFDGLHHVEVPLLADYARAIEAKLKEKNA